MNERFAERMQDKRSATTRGCSATSPRSGAMAIMPTPDATPGRDRWRTLGVYGRKLPVLCEECEAHLAYAEKRRAYCPKDPKPFCAHCDTHCYKPDEREWQREMMRYAGPKSWRKGHAIDGIKHVLEARKCKREMERAGRRSEPAETPNDESAR